MTRSNTATAERLPIPDCVQAVIDRQKARLREKAIARLRQEREEEAAKQSSRVIQFPNSAQPEAPAEADKPAEHTNLSKSFLKLVEDSEGVSEQASKQPIGCEAGTDTETLSAEKRQLWDSEAPILLPNGNGQTALCKPLALDTLTASLINCQNPTELKALREIYPQPVLNYVWVSKLDKETQQRIKSWMEASQPAKEPQQNELLIRNLSLGRSGFRLK